MQPIWIQKEKLRQLNQLDLTLLLEDGDLSDMITVEAMPDLSAHQDEVDIGVALQPRRDLQIAGHHGQLFDAAQQHGEAKNKRNDFFHGI